MNPKAEKRNDGSIKMTPIRAAIVSVNPFGVHPSGCPPPSNTLKRGHGTTVLLLSIAALMTASLLLLCPASAHAQGGVPLWTNRYNGPADFDDLASAIAVDKAGNVFVTGISWNNNCGPTYDADYATVAYSNSGQPLWTNRYNGSEDLAAHHNNAANSIAVDGSGNLFVTG